MTKATVDRFIGEVFLSYKAADAALVADIREQLTNRGVATSGHNDLKPGRSWLEALEEALQKASGVLVFVGANGLGAWQKREVFFALDRQAHLAEGRSYPVIPVLLPGAEATASFLFLNPTIDLRQGAPGPAALDAMCRLLQEGQPPGAPARKPAVCPYVGLRPFTEETSAFFFGRDLEVQHLIAALPRGLIGVVGASGSGKTSLVRAGLVPAVKRQRPPAVTWEVVSFTPRSQPWEYLADALVRVTTDGTSGIESLRDSRALADHLRANPEASASAAETLLRRSNGADRLLIVVDQFEEVLTLVQSSEQRRFVDALMALSASAAISVVLTLRADFYAATLGLSRELNERLSGSIIALGPLTRSDMRATIERPAEVVGLRFESGLVDRILSDVSGDAGDLPLLQLALVELWKRREGDRLTHSAYEEIGSVTGNLALRAEAAFDSLSDSQRGVAHRLFMRLVRVDAASGAVGGLRARREEFTDDEWNVALRLAQDRLLVIGFDVISSATTVELASGTMVRHWPRLQNWAEKDRDLLRWRAQLGVFIDAWRTSGARLPLELRERAAFWLRTRPDDFSREERAYLEAGGVGDTLEPQKATPSPQVASPATQLRDDTTLARVFICYRRDDTEGHTGRLYDWLCRACGSASIIMDVDTSRFRPGADFVAEIDKAISECALMLVVIGRWWLLTGDEGQPRLHDRNDYVAHEIRAALRRGKPIIPIMVHGARMPNPSHWPSDIVQLTRFQGIELSHLRWEADVQRTIEALRSHVEPKGLRFGGTRTTPPAQTSLA